MRVISCVLLAVFLGGCSQDDLNSPAEVKFDRDVCQKCGMVISDRQSAAQVRGGTKRAAAKFDDVGCAMSWLESQPFAADCSTSIWVASLADGKWLDARTAKYVAGKTTPMGYGFGAVVDGAGVDFESMKLGVKAAGGHHH